MFISLEKKSVSEIQQLDTSLEESKARELEWKKLGDFFTQYREKSMLEMQSLKEVVGKFNLIKTEMSEEIKKRESQINELQNEIFVMKDILIRVHSINHRRANVETINQEILIDESKIIQNLKSLKFLNNV